MTLIVAEKESVAEAIADVVGASEKQNGYYCGNGYLVSWCVGHLVKLAKPEAYGIEKWELSTLPIIPSKYITIVDAAKKSRFDVLKELMDRPDVTDLIEATDAGREGELIFRLVYEQAHCSKPFRRLWIQSLESAGIRAGMDALRPGSDYDSLYQAAVCRQRADWLVGINFTRLYTVSFNKTLTCGRVQTPTVSLIVQRQREIENFQPVPYYIVTADCSGVKLRHRVEQEKEAERLRQACEGQNAAVTHVTNEEKKESPAPLYDLTTLQRDANRLLGYSAKQTLEYLQSLYEAKLATYPRTTSKYVTHDQADTVHRVIDLLTDTQIFGFGDLSAYDPESVNVPAVVNDNKVTDHHALLPTEQVTKAVMEELPTGERNILLLLCFRLLSAVYTPRIYRSVKLTAEIAGEEFDAAGRTELQSGFQVITKQISRVLGLTEEKDKTQAADDAASVPEVSEGDVLSVSEVTVERKQTKPPAPYTEDTLLDAMETAGKHIEDAELREAMKDSGLGTPATRADIIENIIRYGYIIRDGKKLLPSDIAQRFVNIVAPSLKDPQLTASWELKLAEIQRGELKPSVFMEEIVKFCREQVAAEKAARKPEDRVLFSVVIGTCPFCGKKIVQLPISYSCEDSMNCKFTIWKKIGGKGITVEQVQKLLKDGRSGLIKGLKSRTGNLFDAYLKIQDDHSIGFEFPPRKKEEVKKKGKR